MVYDLWQYTVESCSIIEFLVIIAFMKRMTFNNHGFQNGTGFSMNTTLLQIYTIVQLIFYQLEGASVRLITNVYHRYNYLISNFMEY